MTKYEFTIIWKRLPFIHYIRLPGNWYVEPTTTSATEDFPISVEWDNSTIGSNYASGAPPWSTEELYRRGVGGFGVPEYIPNYGKATIKKKGKTKPFTVEEREKLQGNRKM